MVQHTAHTIQPKIHWMRKYTSLFVSMLCYRRPKYANRIHRKSFIIIIISHYCVCLCHFSFNSTKIVVYWRRQWNSAMQNSISIFSLHTNEHSEHKCACATHVTACHACSVLSAHRICNNLKLDIFWLNEFLVRWFECCWTTFWQC